MLLFLLFSLCFSPILSLRDNCTLFPQTVSRFDPTIVQAEILCRNVPSNFIITSFHFVKQSYPQDVIITESTLPTLSNYSSLLNMRNVRKLFLKGQGIRSIVPGAFRNMQSLEELDLSYNNLNEIPDGAFTGLENLMFLHLKGNNITVNPQNAFGDLPKLESLDISEN